MNYLCDLLLYILVLVLVATLSENISLALNDHQSCLAHLLYQLVPDLHDKIALIAICRQPLKNNINVITNIIKKC